MSAAHTSCGGPVGSASSSLRDIHSTREAGGYQLLTQMESRQVSRVDDNPSAPKDIVQFTCPIYFVAADEGKIECDIMRIGERKGSLAFNYATKAGSAIAGRQFEMTSGRLEMGPGEDSVTIEVPVYDDPRWDPTTEFTMSLSEPDGCKLGLYLKNARVKVIDAQTFPTDDFREEIAKGVEAIWAINRFSLFGGFVTLMWDFDGMWWRTLVTLSVDQLDNLYVYLRLTLAIYMVDTVFNMDEEGGLLIPGNRLGTSYIVALLIIGPMALLYVAELIKDHMDIKGRLKRDLSQKLMMKFMNYSKESFEEIPTADMVTALTLDSSLTTDGYICVLEMVRLAGKLAVSIFFTLHENPSAWWAVVLVPSLMIMWIRARTQGFTEASDMTKDTESQHMSFINDVLSKLTLIADYNQRPQINELFAQRCESLRQVILKQIVLSKDNMFFPKVLGPALIALYTAVGASLVLSGELKLGVYLATISVFGEICASFSEFFGLVMSVVNTFTALAGITIMNNKAIDVPAWKAVNRHRRAETKRIRAQLLAAAPVEDVGPFVPAADKMEISMTNMIFGHPGGEPIFRNTNLTCPQGVICSVRGQPGQGRRTLLQLIAHKLFPSHGNIFVPSHLRILYVSPEPVLLRLSIWQNITFGNKDGNNPFRVESILKELKMDSILAMCTEELEKRKLEFSGKQPTVAESSKETQHHTADEDLDHAHHDHKDQLAMALDKLRATQKACIHLARAFIMNPELLVLHRPFMYYPKDSGADHSYAHIMDALLEHRDSRGFKMPAETLSERRPRTVFYSPDTREEEVLADHCWVLPKSPDGEVTHTRQNITGSISSRLLQAAKARSNDLKTAEPKAVTAPLFSAEKTSETKGQSNDSSTVDSKGRTRDCMTSPREICF